MRLIIAEKPSLARAIADVLPGPHKKNGDHIECGDGNVVAWCVGHLLDCSPPEAYSPEYKFWRLEHLPISPTRWKYEVSKPKLVASLKRLLARATRVLHGGDPDREGQLLVDELLMYLDYKGPVDRLLINDLSPTAVRRALADVEPNTKYRSLSDSALARQRADWLYGINMTRLYTLMGKSGGYPGVLSVGRVQTPVLGLVTARDRAIELFRPTPHYAVNADLQSADGAIFRAVWRPGNLFREHLDAEGRLLKREIAEDIRRRLQGQAGSVSRAARERKSETPPLPYSLSDLQIDAGRRLGMSAKAVLETCQSLYESRLVTYPRSDCSYLPEGHHAQARNVCASIAMHIPALSPLMGKVDLSLRTKAWNDKKVTAHHAIIPTPNAAANARMNDAERGLYELVARRYLSQFYPPFEFLQVRLEIDVIGECFVANGRQVLNEGWKATLGRQGAEGADREPLPCLGRGDAVRTVNVEVVEKTTEPPKPFTDASLIQAMCGIAKYVTDPNAKKILTETDGIGTPATRAAIIEILIDRGFIRRVEKTLVSTPTGRALIAHLPSVATTPDMTAVWEAALRAISDGTQSYDALLQRVGTQLSELVNHGKALGRMALPSAPQGATRL